MGYILQSPLNLDGSDFTGSNATPNRTYTFPDSRVVSAGLQVIKQGQILQPSSQWSLSSGILTISSLVFDADVISIQWFIDSSISTASGNTEYATPLELNEFMGLIDDTLDRSASSPTFFEDMGQGAASRSKYALSKPGYIADTLSLYYDDSETNAIANNQTLTESTHYSIDNDSGIITLTAAGISAVSTDNVFADYKYNLVGMSNKEVQDSLNRACKLLESITNNLWTDGTQATPNYKSVSDELKMGQGAHQRSYFTKQRPIANVSTIINGAVSASATTITVDSTQGFPSSGSVECAGLKLTYTGKTSTTFTGVSGVTTSIADDTVVNSFIVEYSIDAPGGTPTFTVANKDSDYSIDFETGRIELFNKSNAVDGVNRTIASANPSYRIADRVKISYLRGNDSIPSDIKYAVLALASKDLMKSAVRKAHSGGMNKYNPSLLNVDEMEIKRILKEHKLLRISRNI